MIKAIFIDIDDTLLDFFESAIISMHKSFNKFGLNFRDDYFEMFQNINSQLWHRVEMNELKKDDVYGHRWVKTFEILDIKLDGFEFEKVFLSNLASTSVPFPGTTDLLKRLKQKYPLYVASNAMSQQQFKRLKASNIYQYFDDYFFSEEIGFAKPGIEYYRTCFERLDNRYKPSEVLMIGDSLYADIKGSSEFGMKTCWVNHRCRPISDTIIPTLTVNSLEEITIEKIEQL